MCRARWGYWGLFAVDDTNAVDKTYTPRKQFYTLSQISKFVARGPHASTSAARRAP